MEIRMSRYLQEMNISANEPENEIPHEPIESMGDIGVTTRVPNFAQEMVLRPGIGPILPFNAEDTCQIFDTHWTNQPMVSQAPHDALSLSPKGIEKSV
jgi:hypothetical protein